MKLLWIVAAYFCLCAVPRLHGQTLRIDPNRVMADQPATIRASGLHADERVTIRAELVDGAGERWTSQADSLPTPKASSGAHLGIPIGKKSSII